MYGISEVISMKIGIMGGTFDPIHNAHLQMAKTALQQAGLDQIWFMPSKIPPHKSGRRIVGEEQRSAMIRLAIRGMDSFVFSDYELQRDEITYTAKTLQHLQKDYPIQEFYFIMGGDSFFQFDSWFHPEIIAGLCCILAVARDGVSYERMEQQKRYLEKKYQAKIQVLSMDTMWISSSSIREKIAAGEDISRYVPDDVARYIQKQSLYRKD